MPSEDGCSMLYSWRSGQRVLMKEWARSLRVADHGYHVSFNFDYESLLIYGVIQFLISTL